MSSIGAVIARKQKLKQNVEGLQIQKCWSITLNKRQTAKIDHLSKEVKLTAVKLKDQRSAEQSSRLKVTRDLAHTTSMTEDRVLRPSDRSKDIRTYGKMDCDLWCVLDFFPIFTNHFWLPGKCHKCGLGSTMLHQTP